MAPSIRPFPVDSTGDRANKHDDTKRMLIVPNIKPMPTLSLVAGPENPVLISGRNVLRDLKLKHPSGVSSTGELLASILPILEKEATGSAHAFTNQYEDLLQEIDDGVEERSPFNKWISWIFREMVCDIFAHGSEDPLLQPLPEDDKENYKPGKEAQTLEKRDHCFGFRKCSLLGLRPNRWTAHAKQNGPDIDNTLEPSIQPDNFIDALNEAGENPGSSDHLILDSTPIETKETDPSSGILLSRDVAHAALQPPPPEASGETYPFRPFNPDPAVPLPGRDIAHAALQPPVPEASGIPYPFQPFRNDPAVPLPGPVEANAVLGSREFSLLRRSSFDDAFNSPFGFLILLGIIFGGAVVLYVAFRILKCCTRSNRKTVFVETMLIDGKIHEAETASP